MASLRLAMKLSLEENPNVKTNYSNDTNNIFEELPNRSKTKRKRTDSLAASIDSSNIPSSSHIKHKKQDESDKEDMEEIQEMQENLEISNEIQENQSILNELIDKIEQKVPENLESTEESILLNTSSQKSKVENQSEDMDEEAESSELNHQEDLDQDQQDHQEQEPEPEQEQQDQENTELKPKRKGGRPRNSDLLALGVSQESAVSEYDGFSRSPRAAASIAKSRLKGQLPPPSSDFLKQQDEDKNVSPIKKIDGRKNRAKSSEKDLNVPVITPAPWVMCEACEKWRKLPTFVDITTLPEKWFCSMNEWDSIRNICDADEETSEEPTLTNEVPTTPIASKAMSKAKQVRNKLTIDTRLPRSISNDDGDKPLNSTTSTEIPIVSDNWVECGRCNKWRKVPIHINVKSLPDVWYCSMSTWSLGNGKCITIDEENKQKSSTNNIITNNTSSTKMNTSSATKFTDIQSKTTKGVIETKWICCDRKDCSKWRKVPFYIDFEALEKQKWYCELNTWNLALASCDAPEENEEEQVIDKKPNHVGLITNDKKGQNSLSYRQIIFDKAGKVRQQYGEKCKTGHGIYSFSEKNLYGDMDSISEAKRVSYWASTHYDDNGIQFVSFTGNPNGLNSTLPHPSEFPSMMLAAMSGSREVNALLSNGINTPSTSSYKSNTKASQRQKFDDMINNYHDDSNDSILFHLCNQHRESDPSIRHIWPKKCLKYPKEIQNISILEKNLIYKSLIRTCLISTEKNNMTLSSMFEFIKTCHFNNNIFSYFQHLVNLETLKLVLRDMEENNEVYITVSEYGIPTIYQMNPITGTTNTNSNSNSNSNSNYDEVTLSLKKKSVPLKFRYKESKFYIKLSCSDIDNINDNEES